jgi:Undecaprenyl-phosphate glucose phosphotransferase
MGRTATAKKTLSRIWHSAQSVPTVISPSLQPAEFSRAAQAEPHPAAFKISYPVAAAEVIVLEFLLVAAAALGAGVAYYHVLELQYVLSSLAIAAIFSAASIALRQHRSIRSGPLYRYLWGGIGAVTLAHCLFLSGLFLLKGAEPYSRAIFIIQLFSVAIVVFCARAVIHARIRAAISSGSIEARRAVLIGDADKCEAFSRHIRTSGVQTICSFRLPERGAPGEDPGHLAERLARTINAACRPLLPDDMIILTPAGDLPIASSLARWLSDLPVAIHVVLTDASDVLFAARIFDYGAVATLQVRRQPLSRVEQAVKRAFDVIMSSLALIVFAPLFLIVAVAIKLDSRGPILFRQTRHGFNNVPIRVFKFRTMTTIEDGGTFTQAAPNDPRVTRIGRVLRRMNIDELPQLFNVLVGDMSIVGPRPHAIAHNEMFQNRIWPFERRHNVKPGITGWAQVNGLRGETDTLEKMQRRVEFDLNYIENWSLLLDLKIIILTLFSKSAYRNAY